MNQRSLFLLALALIFPLGGLAGVNPFVGMWQPDMEATLENAKNNPKFKEGDFSKMEKLLPQIIGPMRMQFTDSAFTMKFGKSRQQTAPYTVEKVTDSNAVLLIHPPDQEKQLRATLNRIGDEHLTLRIEGNNDMNIYVWKPAENMDAEDPDMAAITAGVLGAGLKKKSGKEEMDQTPAEPVDEIIRKNLKIIANAANQYMLENGVAEASFADIEGEYFKPLRAANGETYNEIVVTARQESISVTDQDGIIHSVKLR